MASSREGSIGYVVLLTLVAALGGLLFGYDTAVISGAIGFLETHFELDDFLKGWTAASALVGCILGACFAGTLSDGLGRKKVLLLAAVLFGVSAVGSAIATNLTELVMARIVGGIGVGAASMLSPLYIAEISPARIRGRLVSVNQLAIVSGMLAAYFANAVVVRVGDDAWNVAMSWRWMFGLETLPAVLFLVLLFVVPESPRWLTKQGRSDQALAILARVGGQRHAQAEIAEIKDAIARESGSVSQLFLAGMRVPLAIGVGLAILQQVTGINTVLYYGPEIFKRAGLEAVDAIARNVIVGLDMLCFTVVAVWVVDKFGRKPLLLVASAGMGISLFLLGGALEAFAGPWVLVFALIYVASFAMAMGPVVWVVMSEIFPTRVRGRAMSIATVCLWVACFAVTQFFPILLGRIGVYTFFIYAGMCVVSFLFVARCVPETKDKSLEEIERTWLGRTTQAVGRV